VLPQGAAEVAGIEDMTNEVRTQISKGADVIKIYADYRWGKDGEAEPTFSTEAIAWAVAIAKSGNRQVVVHATTAEGMKRAINAGVSTIEHGDGGTEEVFKLMKEKGIAIIAVCFARHRNDLIRCQEGQSTFFKIIMPLPVSDLTFKIIFK